MKISRLSKTDLQHLEGKMEMSWELLTKREERDETTLSIA